MGRNNMMESLSIMLQMIKLMSRKEGATVTELSKELGIDRWSVKYMIDNLEELNTRGNMLFIEEFKSPEDKRKTIYRIAPDSLWTMKLPALNLTEEESILLALLLERSKQEPVLGEVADSLRDKINWINSSSAYMIHSAKTVERITPPWAADSVRIILNAIRDDKCLAFDYNNAGDTKSERREVLPLYAFVFEGTIYLNAQKLDSGELRTYAIDRISGVPETIEIPKSKRPVKLEYDGRLEDPFGPFWDSEEFEITVHFDSWQGWYIMHQKWPESVRVEKLEDGTVLFSARSRCRYGVDEWMSMQKAHIV